MRGRRSRRRRKRRGKIHTESTKNSRPPPKNGMHVLVNGLKYAVSLHRFWKIVAKQQKKIHFEEIIKPNKNNQCVDADLSRVFTIVFEITMWDRIEMREKNGDVSREQRE